METNPRSRLWLAAIWSCAVIISAALDAALPQSRLTGLAFAAFLPLATLNYWVVSVLVALAVAALGLGNPPTSVAELGRRGISALTVLLIGEAGIGLFAFLWLLAWRSSLLPIVILGNVLACCALVVMLLLHFAPAMAALLGLRPAEAGRASAKFVVSWRGVLFMLALIVIGLVPATGIHLLLPGHATAPWTNVASSVGQATNSLIIALVLPVLLRSGNR